MKLTIEYMEKDIIAPPDFVGCWVARFKDVGLTAHGKTIKMATDKLLDMLKDFREVTNGGQDNDTKQ